MILNFPDFWKFSNFPDHFTEFPDFSLTLKKNQISLTFPWRVGTLLKAIDCPLKILQDILSLTYSLFLEAS